MPYKDPAKRRAYERRLYRANAERERERARRRYLAHREEAARYYRENRARIRAARDARRHGDDFQAMWDSQQGCCYLCGEALPADRAKVAVDHDHGCHPGKDSCGFCRRGIAHVTCNSVLGLAGDDPERLSRIAAAFAERFAEVQQRIAGKPQQDQLF